MYKVMKSFVCRGSVNPVTGTGCTSVDIGDTESLIVRGRLYSGCVRSCMLHGSETWLVR